MSLLNSSLSSVISPEVQQEQLVLSKVNSIIKAPTLILQSIYFTWAKAFNDLHGDQTLRPILLEKIGTNGAELFKLNYALTNFMVSQLSGVRDDMVQDILTRVNTLPPFTYHPDGTVTVSVSSLTPELSGE